MQLFKSKNQKQESQNGHSHLEDPLPVNNEVFGKVVEQLGRRNDPAQACLFFGGNLKYPSMWLFFCCMVLHTEHICIVIFCSRKRHTYNGIKQ